MPLYVDQPVWQWRGRQWAHLISDRSFDDLHHAARALQIPERAFDGDHYDIPQERWADVVAYGARPVSSREIVRLLTAAGLRRPKGRPRAAGRG
ncbi:DUF4031 domain-containing protein [Cumulibacter manganitolerans]|uniref:DUF4031 domain-containing protein n=1 Tax=Cumulibacter manganitolerans TaxID=1884992 RepID=UPI001294E51A|nr:DUF4031 domain-containing protein [Cumulibacter manganitolerans]